MAEYNVTARIEGIVNVTIHAESAEEAEQIAEHEIEGGEVNIKWGGVGIDGVASFDSVSRVNVCLEGEEE